MADYILMAAAVLIFFGIGFVVLRLAIGPTVIDRIAAVDALTIVSISTMALYALVAERLSIWTPRWSMAC